MNSPIKHYTPEQLYDKNKFAYESYAYAERTDHPEAIKIKEWLDGHSGGKAQRDNPAEPSK